MRQHLLLLTALLISRVLWADLASDIAGQVSATSYEQYFTTLNVNAGDTRGFDFATGIPQADLLSARVSIYNAFSMVLGSSSVSYQNVTVDKFQGQNIIGVLQGTDSEHYGSYVIGAHYDSITSPGYNTSGSPGADDNATGVAGVMEAARVLSQYQFKASIYFVAFDLEEYRSGSILDHTRGSYTFALNAKNTGLDVRGMLSLDMLGYHFNLSETGVTVSDVTGGSGFGVGVADAMQREGLTVYPLGSFPYSDHLRFNDLGIPAAYVAEADEGNGAGHGDPYYHSNSDYYMDSLGVKQQVNGHDYIDPVYATQLVKGSVNFIATSAIPVPEPASMGGAGMLIVFVMMAICPLRTGSRSFLRSQKL